MVNEICWSKYDPSRDNPDQIPDERGVYIICTKCIGKLPTQMTELKYSFLEGFPVIYVGISGRKTSKTFGLRTRDYHIHFNGTARKSTLRKSLGVLFNYKKIQYINEVNTTKYRFIEEDETELTSWMKNNLLLFYFSAINPEALELELINYFAPPLNLKDNKRDENSEFRKKLSQLRCTLWYS